MEAQVAAHMLELRLRTATIDIETTLNAPWTILFGPSGTGKTTLLRHIAGLDRPDKGLLRLNGIPLTDTSARLHLPPGQRHIGMVTQQPALFPHLTVAQNVSYGLHHLSTQERIERLQETLALTGAAHLMDRSPARLSGGEAQRVALARALAPKPQLLLLDEPFSALDNRAKDSVMSNLRSWLAEHNIAAILVTHDTADALTTDAEVLSIREGRLIAQGPAHQVLREERERLLARLQ